ncbi:MAG: hypothetical protein OMM_11953 [Candidatus Magnetoglobus multicellularis str. Araruama]|uniref:Uncharacterized protein n=1 Tax=Candidatus Magnetoglobus multicellularis str. Araruama TaxID=890399 RepID=A0A1V1NWW6_9BACT|nr:MAG: hypothetical protein OMM_11953 [Candidatus Magnetoglobus multicellularis str. Araruama]
MKSIELKYPVIVRERQDRFDHSKIFRPPGVETPGGRTFLVGRTFFYPKIYNPLLTFAKRGNEKAINMPGKTIVER